MEEQKFPKSRIDLREVRRSRLAFRKLGRGETDRRPFAPTQSSEGSIEAFIRIDALIQRDAPLPPIRRLSQETERRGYDHGDKARELTKRLTIKGEAAQNADKKHLEDEKRFNQYLKERKEKVPKFPTRDGI